MIKPMYLMIFLLGTLFYLIPNYAVMPYPHTPIDSNRVIIKEDSLNVVDSLKLVIKNLIESNSNTAKIDSTIVRTLHAANGEKAEEIIKIPENYFYKTHSYKILNAYPSEVVNLKINKWSIISEVIKNDSTSEITGVKYYLITNILKGKNIPTDSVFIDIEITMGLIK